MCRREKGRRYVGTKEKAISNRHMDEKEVEISLRGEGGGRVQWSTEGILKEKEN